MKNYLTVDQAINLLNHALPDPKIKLINSNFDEIRFEYYNRKFRFAFKILMIEEMDPPGILKSDLTTSLMEHIIKTELYKPHTIDK